MPSGVLLRQPQVEREPQELQRRALGLRQLVLVQLAQELELEPEQQVQVQAQVQVLHSSQLLELLLD
jgi:hypothetical protein